MPHDHCKRFKRNLSTHVWITLEKKKMHTFTVQINFLVTNWLNYMKVTITPTTNSWFGLTDLQN